MTKLLLPLAFLLLALWLFGGTWWYVKTYYKDYNDAFITSTIPPFQVKDGQREIAFAPESFGFRQSSDRLIIGEAASKAFKHIANYINHNPGKIIRLDGRYASFEYNQTEYINLGAARAKVIEGELLKNGVDPDAIDITGSLTANIQFIESICYNCLTFSFHKVGGDIPVNPATENKQIIRLQPLNVYFENKHSIIHMSVDLKEYFDDLKKYLSLVPTAKVIISGHTDNIGSRQSNLKLSATRAREFQKFMVANGFNKNRLEIDFKGPDKPIESNFTAEGRKKNRRIEVRIQ